MTRHVASLIALLAVVAGCHQQPQRVTRDAPAPRPPVGSEPPPEIDLVTNITKGRPADSLVAKLSESELVNIVFCHDTLGRPLPPNIAVFDPYAAERRGSSEFVTRRAVPVSRCTPCTTYRVASSSEAAAAHARKIWLQRSRAPYDPKDPADPMDNIAAACMRRAFGIATSQRPPNDSLSVEMALVYMAWSADTTRARALRTVDSLVQQRVSEGRRADAANILAQFGLGMWDRAQRQLERPFQLEVSPTERCVHQLTSGAPLMTQLPLIPEASQYLGTSEAVWSARLFDAASQLATAPADRSRLMRLALAPWVILEQWSALDSAARAMLKRAPNDSAVLPARALAAYRTISHPVLGAPAVMALFDTAVAHVPRVDSMRIDSFDGVLNAEDDEWRGGFLPDQRVVIDKRAWSVIDPLWTTPINEIRLSRRARVVEADYRYADITAKGESGSETRAGQVLIRRGPPAPQWTVEPAPFSRLTVHRSWPGLRAETEIDDPANDEQLSMTSGPNGPRKPSERDNNWRVFYGTSFSPTSTLIYKPDPFCTYRPEPLLSLYACALGTRAEWRDVPFFERSDDIDVTVARFRAAGDSADMYIGARIPLRGFRSKDEPLADRNDRIEIGAWLTTELGAPVFHESLKRELPPASTIVWTQQWTRRVGSLKAMHRVEAMEARQPAGARGVARFTTDSQVSFPLRGFGMSDVLIASSVTPRGGAPKRWSDLAVQPNGATVAPAERFAMVWEVYDLARGADERVHWRVRLKRERGKTVEQYGMQQTLSGAVSAGSRVVADESTAPDMSYERNELASAVVLENITFGLGDFPPGQHVVNVTIDDLVSGKSVTRGVSVRVVTPESQKRGTKIRSPAR